MRRQTRRLVRRMLATVGPPNGLVRPTRPVRTLQGPLDRFVVTVLSSPNSLAEARRLTARTLDRWGLPERAADAAVVVSELAGNAFRHGRAPVRLVLRCEASNIGPTAACTVRDAGRWSGARIPDRAMVEAAMCDEGGRGLYIARELADSLTVRAARYRLGTAVTATFTARDDA